MKNTFIEVSDEAQNSESSSILPRAVSDQSHSRPKFVSNNDSYPKCSSIPEDSPNGQSEELREAQKLELDELRTLRTISRPQYLDGMMFTAHVSAGVSYFPACPPLLNSDHSAESRARCTVSDL